MRSTNSIKNAIVAAIMNGITIIIGFIAQRIFIQTLGTEYLGINGLFTNRSEERRVGKECRL